MRQEFTTGVATITVRYRNGDLNITNPFPESKAWQWISGSAYVCRGTGYWECIIGVEVMVMLTVSDSNSTTEQVAYFDNLHLSASFGKDCQKVILDRVKNIILEFPSPYV